MAQMYVSSASAIGTSIYLFPYYPAIFEGGTDNNVNRIDILHGPASYQKSAFDSRERTLRYEGNRLDDPNMISLLAFVKARLGKVYYINFQSINGVLTFWPSVSPNKKMKFIDVRYTIPKGGKLYYSTFDIIICPEP